MALKLTLSPNEKLVVNGAVIQNGDRRASVVVRNKASILREKDILLPDQAVTPMRRVYFEIMMMYLDEKRQKPHFEAFSARITEFMNAIRDSDAIGRVNSACSGRRRDEEQRTRCLRTCG